MTVKVQIKASEVEVTEQDMDSSVIEDDNGTVRLNTKLRMPTVDNTAVGHTGGTDTATVSLTTSTGTNYLYIAVATRGNVAVSTITYNSVSCSYVRNSTTGSDLVVEFWKLENPSIGTYNLVVTLASAQNSAVGVLAMRDVDTLLGASTNTGTGTAVTTTSISSSVDAMSILILGIQSAGITITHDNFTSAVYQNTGSVTLDISVNVPGNGIESPTATLSVSETWCSILQSPYATGSLLA